MDIRRNIEGAKFPISSRCNLFSQIHHHDLTIIIDLTNQLSLFSLSDRLVMVSTT